MSRTAILGLLLLTAVPTVAEEPARSEPKELARYDRLIGAEDRKHWSFQPIRRPLPPLVAGSDWLRNPIDNFILGKLETKGWQPAPPAEKYHLIRRVYLDLIGLPPTPDEVETARNDKSEDWYDKIVDRLLASPQYGERWGRHWLDLVRFAETNGYERDGTKPFAWRYRDYVIQSFNEDKPYDRFIREQLAGDELPDTDATTLIATGYYRLGPWDDEPADPKEDRFDQLDDMVSTTSQVFLGLTLACARCHNHKFEPLTQLDYYRMVAVFNPLQRPRNGRTELDLPLGTRAQVEAEMNKQRRSADLIAAAAAHRRLAFGSSIATLAAATPLGASVNGWLVKARQTEIAGARAQLDQTEAEVRRVRSEAGLPRGYYLNEPSPIAPATFLLKRGQAARPGPEVPPGMPAVLAEKQPAFPPPGPGTSLRRLTLARWIANADNPLTARVIVNRIWQQHFGHGLVRSPSDFGTHGEPPTHPELLDWLADRFVRDGWSIKRLHRLILTSSTFRMSQAFNAEYAIRDPENQLLWRMSRRRLEVEAIRDAMLAVSGQLNLKMGGPSMLPAVPREALEGSSDPDKIWKPSDEREASRRTVYVFIKRSMVVPLLEVLDLCDTARSTAQRNVTSVAPQALTLFNGGFVNRQALHFAGRLLREVGDDADRQIERAYQLLLCRPPKPAERMTLRTYLTEEAKQQQSGSVRVKPLDEAAARTQALAQMCRVLFNLNEFVYGD